MKRDDLSHEPCHYCQGHKAHRVTDDDLRSMRDELLPILLVRDCATCNGSGRLPVMGDERLGTHVCPDCNGRGTVPAEGVLLDYEGLWIPLSMLEVDGNE